MWLNVPKAAEYAGVSRWTITRWMKDGLTHYRLNGNNVRIHPDDVDSYIRRFKSGIDVDAEVAAIMTKIRRGKK
jgi:excisionase family DNA binding protein